MEEDVFRTLASFVGPTTKSGRGSDEGPVVSRKSWRESATFRPIAGVVDEPPGREVCRFGRRFFSLLREVGVSDEEEEEEGGGELGREVGDRTRDRDGGVEGETWSGVDWSLEREGKGRRVRGLWEGS